VHFGAARALRMGFASLFSTTPPPGLDIADNGLAAGVHRHMLDRDRLLATGPVEPTPADHLEISEVDLPELVGRRGLLERREYC